MSQGSLVTNIKFKTLLNNISNKKLFFVNESFKVDINETISNFFPKLNNQDKNVLIILTTYVIDIISYKYGFEQTNDYFYQWKQNNYRDLKGVILLLLPFIDDKNNGNLLNKITDLNQLLYAYKENSIPNNISNLVREDILSTHFEYGNMGIGLIPDQMNTNKSTGNLLELYENDEKLIYKVIHHTFIGLLQTLEIINGKSYINWVNIVPLNLNNYIDSKLYIQTKNRINLLLNTINKNNINENNFFLSMNLIEYNGLWFGDLYNIIRYKYYEEAKIVKWFFFPYEISDDNKIYLIQGLNKMLNLEFIINSNFNNFNDLFDLDKINFENKINKIISDLKINNTVTGNFTVDIEIIKYSLIYFINNYSNKDIISGSIIKKFKLSQLDNLDESNEDFTEKELKQINQVTLNDIIEFLEFIKSNYLDHYWNYLKQGCELLMNSPYGKFLILENEEINKYYISTNYYYEPFNSSLKTSDDYKTFVKNKINLKNIYNIAKSLSHDNAKSWNLLEQNYISLDDDNKINYFKKISNSSIIKAWLNLEKNFERQFIGVSYDYNQQINRIFNAFKNIFVNLVFEELVSTGILNKFVPNREITDKLLLPTDFGPRKNKIKELLKKNFDKNKEEWLNSFYYVTNQKFKKLDKLRLDKNNIINPKDKYDEYSYFDVISKDHEWPIFYAMDWVSQISFFQHYIYHQVLYVTGATGQGKSTQVPKLLLYALKAIDYKSNGKVICTQPRVPPTIGNATRISDELGVSVEQTSNTSVYKIKTNNYYVQYKYKNDSHINDTKLHGFLRIVTDGTLLEELKENPTLFKNIPGEKPSDPVKYINKNIYDIIIVDEAHEHNINMDIIIALSKQVCYFNNKVRLIIVSATMDDDEPVYRRYFNKINDNLLFPIKYPIPFHPILSKNASIPQQFIPQPFFMDRRYHISPPGETTQYRVDEIYLDSNPYVYSSDNSVDNKLSSIEAQKLGYNKIIEICEKSNIGEILFFANGQGEILKATEYLNANLPPGNIALPYFADLNENYKNIITKINLKISQIRNKRENIHLEWGPKYIEDLTVPLGIYKRSIIIATNVAEASVTIPGLAYVVDNGYAKVNRFKPEFNTTVLEVQPISESSRVQRKGRVGRVGDGTVYYMYKRDARKSIKPKYKITQEDIATTLLGLLAKKDINEIDIDDEDNLNRLIVSKIINPNFYQSIIKNPINLDNNIYSVKSGLYDIYVQNYLINIKNQLTHLSYYNPYFIEESFKISQNKEEIKIPKFIDYSFITFSNGQSINNILDTDGMFYLIHPFENSIKRNILNNIIMYEHIKTSKIPIEEYRYIISYLFNKNLIVDLNGTSFYNYDLDIRNDKRIWYKTELAEQIMELSSKLQITINDGITLISASAMNCLTEVMEIKIFLEVLGKSMTNLVSSNIKWEQFKNIYSDNKVKSDLIFIYKLIQNIKKQFSHIYAFNISSNYFKVILKEHFENILDRFKKLSEKYKEPPTDFDGILWNKLSTLKNNGILHLEYEKILLEDTSTLNIILYNIKKYDKEIIEWCDKNYINSELILDFIIRLGGYQLTNGLIENNSFFNWGTNLSSNFNKQLTQYNIEERILRSFIYGRPFNFTYSINKSNKKATYMNLNYYPVVFAKSRFKPKILDRDRNTDTNVDTSVDKLSETLTNLSHELTFYLNYDTIEDENIFGLEKDNSLNVSILSQIETKWLIPAIPLFMNPLVIPDIQMSVGIFNNKVTIEYPNSHIIQMLKREIINGWDKNAIVWSSDETPILKYFYKLATKHIKALSKN